MLVIYRYVGQPGDHYYGVPARDLTPADLAALSDEQRAQVAVPSEQGGIYAPVVAVVVDFAEVAPAAEDAPAPAGRKGKVS